MASSPRRVAVVGSGCAGLAAAHALSRAGVRVTLLEAAECVGGHADTRLVEGVPVDVGFMVFNRVTYPNMARVARACACGVPRAAVARLPGLQTNPKSAAWKVHKRGGTGRPPAAARALRACAPPLTRRCDVRPGVTRAAGVV
jgi:phytoene dehydrogenase-like protein